MKMNRLQAADPPRLMELLSIRVALWLIGLVIPVGGLGWYLEADSLYLLMALLVGLAGFAAWVGLRALPRSRQPTDDGWQPLVEGADEIFLKLAGDGTLVYLNRAWQTLTEYPLSDALGRPLSQYVCPDDQPRFFHLIASAGSRTDARIVDEIRLTTAAGGIRWMKLMLYAAEAGAAQAGQRDWIGVLRDVTAAKLAEQALQATEQKLQQLDYHDTLTGLPNRRLFKDRLEQALAQARRNNALLAILVLDLDHFKDVNESFGHGVGDRLLQTVAQRLSACIRKSDTVARLGGDEFVILLTAVNSDQNVSHVAEKILTDIAEIVALDDSEILTTTSLGVALFPHDGSEAETLLKHAAMAMSVAKEKGRNNYQFFSDDMNRQAMDRHQLEFKLRRALEREELALYYQPQWDMQNRRLVGLEALLRWTTEADGMIPPSRFIPVAEDTGLIRPIGEWVLLTACRQLKAWQQMGFTDLRVAVNISARQFRQPDLVSKIDRILAETGLEAQFLELELTESYLMEDAHAAIRTLEFLKVRGIQLAIDDFGTGYSSLNYLKNFPIDRIKIDQSFVREVTSNHDDAAIVGAIIAMAQSLDLDLVAEGVEGSEQLKFLLGHNCFTMQGYFFARPMPAAEMQLYLQDSYRRQANPGLYGDVWQAEQPA